MTKPSFTKMELGVFLACSMKHLGALLFTCLCLAAALHAQAGYSAIVVSSDEWVFDDTAINLPCCQDALFAMNVAKFLVPLGGTVLIQSPGGNPNYGHGLNGTKLKTLLTGMGATVIEENTCPLFFCLFQPFDAIFVSGDPTGCAYSPAALVTYVKNGGHVFLEVGTGCCGGAADEANTSNVLLNPFGLTLAKAYNNICNSHCPLNVSAFQSRLPFGPSLFANQNAFWCFPGFPCGVSNIYYADGQDMSLVPPTQSCSFGGNQGQVFSDTNGNGLYAAMKCCPQNVLQSSISALVSGPYGTAYVPSADWFSSVPNVSQ